MDSLRTTVLPEAVEKISLCEKMTSASLLPSANAKIINGALSIVLPLLCIETARSNAIIISINPPIFVHKHHLVDATMSDDSTVEAMLNSFLDEPQLQNSGQDAGTAGYIPTAEHGGGDSPQKTSDEPGNGSKGVTPSPQGRTGIVNRTPHNATSPDRSAARGSPRVDKRSQADPKALAPMAKKIKTSPHEEAPPGDVPNYWDHHAWMQYIYSACLNPNCTRSDECMGNCVLTSEGRCHDCGNTNCSNCTYKVTWVCREKGCDHSSAYITAMYAHKKKAHQVGFNMTPGEGKDVQDFLKSKGRCYTCYDRLCNKKGGQCRAKKRLKSLVVKASADSNGQDSVLALTKRYFGDDASTARFLASLPWNHVDGKLRAGVSFIDALEEK